MGRRGHLIGPTALFGSIVWAARTCERAYPCTSRLLHGAVPKNRRIPYKPIFATSRPLLIEIPSEIVCPCQEYHVRTIDKRNYALRDLKHQTPKSEPISLPIGYYVSPKHPKLLAPVKNNVSELFAMAIRD